ncbi:MAG: FAD-binding protein [Candidatus Nanohaloarchaeota archaeon QJJ-5]|nr:FAD-binding protein [Candidatus Nanohaloarchaeota archaeon QJJ-5]
MEYTEIETEVLIIGAGGAGIRTAIELDKHDTDCLMLGKREHGDAHTVKAAGGINASLGSLDPEDRWDIHAADTLEEGHFINQPEAVEMLCKNVPERVLELQDWGCDFNLTDDGKINQRYFGAQSYRRTCFVGDHTGDAIEQTLVDTAKERDIDYRENVFITKLLGSEAKIAGAFGYDMETGEFLLFKARAVVLAAGGYSHVYKRSSSRPDENHGDGPALAFDIGVPLRDMEMVQFHPTGMVKPEEKAGSLATEAIRGEGGKLYNSDGERFMEKYSPKQMELDARDVVARANYQEIMEGRGTEDGGVLLDISHKDEEFIKERLPSMYEKFKEYNNVDITEEPMEVAPTSHYSMGGVVVDFETGQTPVEGLFAVGEVTSGLHGGNRLGGNSLAEIVTFGAITGKHVASYVEDAPREIVDEDTVEDHIQDLQTLLERDEGHDPDDVMHEIQEIMWEHAGIVRTEQRLQEGLEKLEDVESKVKTMRVDSDITSRAFEHAMDVQFMLPVAKTIMKGALERDESRAAHYRDDHQDEREEWEKNILFKKTDDGMEMWTEDVPPMPRTIKRAVEEGHELDYHHLE